MSFNSYEIIHETEENVYNFELIEDRVLIKYYPDGNNITNGGILSPKGDWEGAAARNVVRLGEVIKIPKILHFSPKKAQSMHWKTSIEVKPGDIVVVDHMESNNATKFSWKGEHFKLISYRCIDAVRRRNEIIPVNGNVLIKPVTKKLKALSYEKDIREENMFEVCYAGTPNEAYLDIFRGRSDFKYPLKKGEKVVIFNEELKKLRHLEQPEFAELDGNSVYHVCKRYMIGGILKD